MKSGNIYQDAAAIRKVKSGGVEKTVLVLDVFENVEHQQDVKGFPELIGAVVNIITIDLPAPGHALAQGTFM